MNTFEAWNDTAFDRLRADMAKRETEAAERDRDNTQLQVGLWITVIVVLVPNPLAGPRTVTINTSVG